MNDPVHIHQEPVNVREMEKIGYHNSNVFNFRWLGNNVIEIWNATFRMRVVGKDSWKKREKLDDFNSESLKLESFHLTWKV